MNILNQLSRYLVSLLGKGIGRAIKWYANRGYSLSRTFNRLVERGFQNTYSTVADIYSFFNKQSVAAIKFTTQQQQDLLAAIDVPTQSITPTKLRYTYDIIVEDDNADREVFGQLIADCDDGLTKKQILDCIYKNADNFLNYYDYQVKAYSIKIRGIESF